MLNQMKIQRLVSMIVIAAIVITLLPMPSAVADGGGPAPKFNNLLAEPGESPGSIKLTGVDLEDGSFLRVIVSSQKVNTPNRGDVFDTLYQQEPDKYVFIRNYDMGSDIMNVDAMMNKYVGLYEVDGSDFIQRFSEITLNSGDIQQRSYADPLDNLLTVTPSPSYTLMDVAYGKGKYVAVDDDNILTSDDGIHWEGKNAYDITQTGGALHRVVYIDGRFVISGSNGRVITSADGEDWENRSIQNNVSPTTGLTGIAYGNDIFVVVDSKHDRVYISDSNLENWDYVGNDYNFNDVTFHNGIFYAVRNDSMHSSTDGRQWVPLPDSVGGITVSYMNDRLVVTRSNGEIWSSGDNGETWLQLSSSDFTNSIYRIAYNKGMYVAVGRSATILSSHDEGQTWKSHATVGKSADFHGVAFDDNDNIVIVGSGRIMVNLVPPLASDLKPLPTAHPGSQAGSTQLTGMSLREGNTLMVQVKSVSTLIPNEGEIAPSGASVYTSGSDITGVDATTNKYVAVYELDSIGHIVKFSEIILTEDDINSSIPSVPVPQFRTTLTAQPGTEIGSTQLTGVSAGAGNRLELQVSSSQLATPNVGDGAPMGTSPYTIGSDITGVDTETNKYIGLYEIDNNDEVVKFSQIELAIDDIKLFAGGNGTVDDPYLIATADQLNNMRYKLNGHFKVINNIDLDIAPYNTAKGWEPIGSLPTPFVGTFDGGKDKGFTISNLMINTDESYLGLFGNVHNASIKNVDLAAVTINQSTLGGSAGMVGALAGAAMNSTILNSTSQGEITGRDYIGGLIGKAIGETIIKDSSSSVDILLPLNSNNTVLEIKDSNGDLIKTAYDYRGGLVGYVDGAHARVTINNSRADGEVQGVACVGGLIGIGLYVDIIDSHASGIVTGYNIGTSSTTSDNAYSQIIGGLAGRLANATVNKSYSESAIVKGRYSVAGFVGQSNGSNYYNNYSRSFVEGEQVAGFIYAFKADHDIRFAYTTDGVYQIESTWYGFAPKNAKAQVSEAYYVNDDISEDKGLGVGLSSADLKNQNTFASAVEPWDFTEIWTIDPNINDGFPYFKTKALPIPAQTPVITTQPSDKNALLKETVTLSVAAEVNDGGKLSYQWYSNSSNSTTGGTALTGASKASFHPPTITVGTTYYYVVITNTNDTATGEKTVSTASTVVAVKVEAHNTPNPNPNPNPIPNPNPTEPQKEEIMVDVATGDGEVIAKTPIERTIHSDGKVLDKVTFTPERALEAMNQLRDKGAQTARIIIPDKEDKVTQTDVNVGIAALKTISDGQANLEIVTDGVVVLIPNESLENFNDDLYFRFIPIKTEDDRKVVEERAKKEEIVREVAQSMHVNVLGRPMTIETNMQSRPVTLIMPITDVLPTDAVERQAILDNIVVFIEHSDGTKELIRGDIITDASGKLGVQFGINKFSTFTMIYMEGWKEYFAKLQADTNQKEQSGRHEPYMYGFPDGTFGPDRAVTRAQMAAMLARNVTSLHHIMKETSFTDVNTEHWAFAYIELVNEHGLIIGYPDGTFGAEDSITRAQMAVIVDRWLLQKGKHNAITTNDFRYTDLSNNHWAYDAIMRVQATGIMVGDHDARFNSEQTLTRAEAVKVLNRLFERGPLYGVTESSFSDVPITHWAFADIEEAVRPHQWQLDQSGKEKLK